MQKTLKGKVGAFFRPWTGSSDEAPSLEDIIRFTSKSYESLTCPQLIKLEVGTQVRLVHSPLQVNLMEFVGNKVPVVIRNSGSHVATVTLRSGSKVIEVEPLDLHLAPGESQGHFLKVSPIECKTTDFLLQVGPGVISGEIPISVRVRKKSFLRVKVLDEMGLQTPARVYLTGADGKRYTPAGIIPRITSADYGQPYGGEYYFYTGGGFSLDLPQGETHLEVIKGLEYAPLRKTFQMPESGVIVKCCVWPPAKRRSGLPGFH